MPKVGGERDEADGDLVPNFGGERDEEEGGEKGEEEGATEEPEDPGMWEESFKSHRDSKPYGEYTRAIGTCTSSCDGGCLLLHQDPALSPWTSRFLAWSMCTGSLSMPTPWPSRPLSKGSLPSPLPVTLCPTPAAAESRTGCTTSMSLSTSWTTRWLCMDPSPSCWLTSTYTPLMLCFCVYLSCLHPHSWSKTVGVFWHNAAETWIDITNAAANKVLVYSNP